jgi:hypothetical protein
MFDDHWRSCCRSKDSAEKGPSRHHISEDQKIPEKYQEILFYQKTEEARRRRREEQQGGLTTRGCGPTPGHAGLW